MQLNKVYYPFMIKNSKNPTVSYIGDDGKPTLTMRNLFTTLTKQVLFLTFGIHASLLIRDEFCHLHAFLKERDNQFPGEQG